MPHRIRVVAGQGGLPRRWTRKLLKTGLHTLRPVLLAALAAGGFALLLRWHQGKFERDMVSNFEHYQSQAAGTISDSIQRGFSEVTKNLRLASAYPETRLLNPRTRQVVQASYETYRDVSRTVFVADANGQVLYCAPADRAPDRANWPVPAEFFSAQSDRGDEAWFGRNPNGSLAQVLVPIRSGGKLAGVVGGEISLPNLMAQCLSRSDDAKRSKCWVIGPDGHVIYRGRGQIAPGDEESLRLEAHVKVVVSDKCVRRGLAEVMEVSGRADKQDGLIVTFVPFILGESRYGLAIGSSKSGISVPLNSHKRVIYALIGALSLLYFATGYLSYRSEKAHTELAEQRRSAAEAASRAKSDFLAKMSHEIRTPMHGILGMTDLVLESDLTAQQRRCLDLAKRSADSLMTVINDILDISKIEAGKFRLTVVPFNLRDCLEDTVEPFGPRARAEGIELSLRMDPSVPSMVIGDPGRVRQIVTNLVGNAMKFTRQGSVTVGVKVAQESPDSVRLEIEVCDTGIGIPPEGQAKIFDAFEQADGATSRKYGGTGLGLAISAQLVEMMTGRLGVQSEPGKGSRFFFDVKLGLLDRASAEYGAASMKAMTGMRAMVVDLDEANGVRLSHLLTTWQMKAIHLRSGAEALSELCRSSLEGKGYQLVILDACLGDMEGFEMARRIRQLPGQAEVVLMVFAAGIRGDSDRCRELDIRAYLPKPVDPAALLRAIAATFGDPAGRRLITRHWLRENLRRLRILLADDDEVNQEHGRMLLERWGHDVHCACNGREALEVLAAREFDLVLMDVQMPEMDGLAATRAIRAAEEGTGRHIPIIAMTADAMAEARDKCLQAGMDAYVSKPVQAEALLSEIEEVSRRHIAEAQHRPNGDSQPPWGAHGPPRRHDEPEGQVASSRGPAGAGPDETADTPGQAAGPAEPLDMARAINFAGGSRATLNRLGKLFTDGLPALRADMRCALDAHAADLLRKATHRIRGSVALFGADSTCAAAEKLSEAAQAADWPQAAQALGRLERELERLTALLEALQKEGQETKGATSAV